MRVLILTLALLSASAGAHAQELPGTPLVRIETSQGAFVIALDAARAPLSTANFLQYVADGHYAGTVFHRVIANFVAQGGGYTADGTEKPVRPGIPNESGNGLSNQRGTVALARTDDPHGASAQFYVNLYDNHMLDPQASRWGYAVFGRVVEGMEVLDRIGGVATGLVPPLGEDVPLAPVLILKAERLTPAPAVR